MILEFRCSNFCSINDGVNLSMQAVNKIESFTERLIDCGDSKYLRSAQIYGANGSGKTTILLAIKKTSIHDS